MSIALNKSSFNLLNMRGLRDRLSWAISRADISQSELARRAHISRGAVSLWFSGDTKSIKGQNLTRAADALRVNARWLATGEGSPELLDAAILSGVAEPAAPEYRATHEDKQFVILRDAWQRLDAPLRKHLLEIAKALAEME